MLEDSGAASLRFSLPKDFNDPYELFLQPSGPLSSEEHRAFYQFFLGDVVQAPALCFSRRPDSVTMWAHYASEGEGIALAFDEDSLAEEFAVAYFADVDYSDQPATVDVDLIERAFGTGKRRDGLNLLSAAHRAAFFRKRTEWGYERERRLVVSNDAVSTTGELLTVALAPRHMRYLILGSRSNAEIRALCEARAGSYGLPLLEFRTGKRSVEPYFARLVGTPLRWDGGEFQNYASACRICGEPATTDSRGACSWCGIGDDARRVAATRNMLAATLQYGIDKGVPLEFEGLVAKGRLAEKHMAKMKQRRDAPGLEDVALQIKLFEAMKRAGHI